MIGVGWTGSIMARELTKAGLKVVGLERGAKRMPSEDFTLPNVRDDLKYAVRQELFQDAQEETVTLPPFAVGDGVAGPQARRVPAGHRARRRGLALERPDLADFAVGPQAPDPSHRALWPQRHSGRDDDRGFPRQL